MPEIAAVKVTLLPEHMESLDAVMLIVCAWTNIGNKKKIKNIFFIGRLHWIKRYKYLDSHVNIVSYYGFKPTFCLLRNIEF